MYENLWYVDADSFGIALAVDEVVSVMSLSAGHFLQVIFLKSLSSGHFLHVTFVRSLSPRHLLHITFREGSFNSLSGAWKLKATTACFEPVRKIPDQLDWLKPFSRAAGNSGSGEMSIHWSVTQPWDWVRFFDPRKTLWRIRLCQKICGISQICD